MMSVLKMSGKHQRLPAIGEAFARHTSGDDFGAAVCCGVRGAGIELVHLGGLRRLLADVGAQRRHLPIQQLHASLRMCRF